MVDVENLAVAFAERIMVICGTMKGNFAKSFARSGGGLAGTDWVSQQRKLVQSKV